MKKQKFCSTIALVLLTVLFLPACSNSNSNTDKSTDYPSLEECLTFSDIELAENTLSLELTENDNAYYTDPSLYEDWEPSADEGGATSPASPSFTTTYEYGHGSIEDVALFLTKRHIQFFMHPDSSINTNFLITAYKDISVTVYSEDTLPEQYKQYLEPKEGEPNLTPDLSAITWYVQPDISYKFIGEIDGVGNGNDFGEDEWVTNLGSENEICFAITLFVDSGTYCISGIDWSNM